MSVKLKLFTSDFVWVLLRGLSPSKKIYVAWTWCTVVLTAVWGDASVNDANSCSFSAKSCSELAPTAFVSQCCVSSLHLLKR